ncbi:MAG: bifunctional folylpolyglutamate synthase/dihydrofolate synthase [Alphaproteobacteria bacterium]|nr:bifunctional folylpolyglutamate synthase/dihydrofolate synthase [Alphaproteobacteria bacterium]MBU0797255.1 bifunctional folylpolyglutamate synthase/dihydrofolate synthase [Alphaproteobacteria bacterium]MBU0888957.1 bifunctional folylpolyglutamate synthase/dihydrofolate synthase [Alphaproteobacteria bacterium]MBU1813977.1 bifunctional folylpolyglutamate synthase/dihydrofolate synthase [Alphaproteobacteria bacterium]MBU2090211.1 bifunctional folylpolyglutamate synthase/dihydrofolate synthase 
MAGTNAILERLKALHPKLIDLSLDRVWRLLNALDHPERRLPPVIHIAGTNGKGSLLAYLRAIYEAAGYTVHAYTSPHLVRFNERFYVAGAEIDDASLAACLEACETANAGLPITLFEITTAAGLLAFARTPADVLILETGLGGRLDATNVVDKPLATAITAISMDHMQYLGDTIRAIAGEKAAIMKPGVPAICSVETPEVLAVLEAYAAQIGAPLARGGIDWTAEAEGNGFTYRSPAGTRHLPLPVLPGLHQIGNAGTALAVVEAAMPALPVDDTAILKGLQTARWPARMQRLAHGPLIDTLPQGWELWLDGGHNGGAGQVIAASARTLWADRQLHLVFGMLDTKVPVEYLRPFAGLAETVQTVTIPEEAIALPAEQTAEIARTLGLSASPADSVAEAVRQITASADRPGRILICGSLYLAGYVLRENA